MWLAGRIKMRFSLLHISDLHFQEDQENLVRTEALVSDILSLELQYPAHLIISGDLVDNGGENHYDKFFEVFLYPIINKFHSIHCTPGNHDIQRDRTSQEKCEQILNQRDDAYLWNSEGVLAKCSPFKNSDPLENYFAFQEVCCSNDVHSYFGSVKRTDNFDLITLNSAWMSCDRADGGDKGFLRIESIVIDKLVKHFSKASIKIVVTHHPVDWLDENIKQQVESRIGKYFDLHLCGHAHYNKTSTQISESGDCICIQASASKSDYSVGNNGYSIIDVDEQSKAIRVRHRVYAPSRNVYVEGDEITPNGVAYPSKRHEETWKQIEQTDTSSILAKCGSKMSDEVINDWYEKNFTGKNKVYAKFVEPEFTKLDTESNLPSKMNLDALIERQSQRVVIKGPGDSGLSTTAFLAGKRILQRQSNPWTIPTYINLDGQSINRANLLRLARNGAPFELSKKEIESLCSQGEITFLIDGISFRDANTFNKLILVLDQHLGVVNVIIFCTSNRQAPLANAHLELHPNKDEVYELCQMSASSIGDLIKGWNYENEFDRVSMVSKVVSSFKQMDEPVFPPTVLLLLETLKQLPDFQPINRVQLLDRYVECLLGRLQSSDVRQGNFNSTDKIRFLSNLSAYFVEKQISEVSTQEWSEFCEKYSTSLLIDLPETLLDEFLEKGILFEVSGYITFRADYLFTYFVAKEMSSNRVLFDNVMSGEYFFRCLREMTFFCELEEANNANVLSRVQEVLNEIENKVFDIYNKNEINFDDEWQEMVSEKHTAEREIETEIEKLSEQKPTAESVLMAQQNDLSSIQRKRGITNRDDIRHLESKWLAVLTTYLQLVKHSINIDAEAKIHHFSAALKSSGLFMKGLAAKRHLFVEYPYVIVSGVLYINHRVLSDPQRAKSEIKYAIPTTIAEFVFEHLFNSQLLPVFRKFVHEADEETGHIVARLLLGTSDKESQRNWEFIFRSVLSPVMKKSALNSLKKQYLGYAVTKQQRQFFENILTSLAKNTSELTQHQMNQLKYRSKYLRMTKGSESD